MKIKFINRELKKVIFVEHDDGRIEDVTDEKMLEEHGLTREFETWTNRPANDGTVVRTPATPAIPATPATATTPAVPAVPATPAVPAREKIVQKEEPVKQPAPKKGEKV